MRRLASDTYVDGERYKEGTSEKDMPSGVVEAITNPKCWTGGAAKPDPDSEGAATEGYAAKTAKQLQAEIADRNEGREEDALIKPAGKNKGDLIAALEADDAADGTVNLDYEAMDAEALQAEIERRNEDRDEDSQIDPAGDEKEDLIAALEADDTVDGE